MDTRSGRGSGFSRRMAAVQTSGTVRFSALLHRLRQEGRDVVDLAVGEPMEPPHPSVIEATRKALADGLTRYGPAGGLPELRDRLSLPFPGWTGRNVLVANGSKQALYQVFQVLCDPGDEVVVPGPCWGSFLHQIRLAGAEPVVVETRGNQPDLEAMAAAVTPRTRAVLVNSPNNPTGAVYPADTLRGIGALCIERGLWAVADEAYADFVYDGAENTGLFDQEGLRDRLVVLRSFSKGHVMTGFRIGYAAAPAAAIGEMEKLQSHLTGNPCTFAQYGALAALDLPPEWFESRRILYQQKRDVAVKELIRWFDFVPPQGAFYVFADFQARYPGRFDGSEAISGHLLDAAGVAAVPGAVFGSDRHVRISFAAEIGRLEEGLDRIGKVL